MVKVIDVKVKLPERTVEIIDKLIKRGYYPSWEDFVRTVIVKTLIDDYELGMAELEPDLIPDYEEDD
ncbi:MAG: hypothetical protein ACFFCZ_21745 [Promethearchaeota archaeon]